MTKKNKKTDNSLVKNRKAFHEYYIKDKYEAGIELKGTEVKSCRESSISLADSYVRIKNGEAFLLNLNISPYKHGNIFNHDPVRPRRLLLHKREILKLSIQIKEKGLTLLPLRFYIRKGKVKVELGIAKGKTNYDKRETMRKKQDNMDARKAVSRIK